MHRSAIIFFIPFHTKASIIHSFIVQYISNKFIHFDTIKFLPISHFNGCVNQFWFVNYIQTHRCCFHGIDTTIIEQLKRLSVDKFEEKEFEVACCYLKILDSIPIFDWIYSTSNYRPKYYFQKYSNVHRMFRQHILSSLFSTQ